MRLVVVANGGSGGGADPRQVEERLRGALEKAGAPASTVVRCVRGHEIKDTCAREARPGTRLVAAGGDGTVGCVASAAAASGAELAVVPLGTLNHFAKDAGVPLGLEEAVKVATTAPARPVDVATANGQLFLNNLSIGAYAHAVRVRRKLAKGPSRAAKWQAMARASWTVLRRLPRERLDLRIDGNPVRRVASLLMVGNGAYRLEMPGFGTRDDLGSGLLGLVVVRATRPRDVLRLSARAAVGRLRADRDLEAVTCRHLVIGADRPGRMVRAAMDGEAVLLRTPIEVRILPGALQVALPPPAPAEAAAGGTA